MSSAFYASIGFGLLVAAINWLAAPLIAGFFRMEYLTPVVRALALVFPIAGIATVPESLLQHDLRSRAGRCGVPPGHRGPRSCHPAGRCGSGGPGPGAGGRGVPEPLGGLVAPFQVQVLGMMFRTCYRMSDSLSRATRKVYHRAWRQGLFALLVFLGAVLGQTRGAGGVRLAFFLNYLSIYRWPS